MKLLFADTQREIETEVLTRSEKFEDARFVAKKTNQVIEIKDENIELLSEFHRVNEKPVSVLSDETFDMQTL